MDVCSDFYIGNLVNENIKKIVKDFLKSRTKYVYPVVNFSIAPRCIYAVGSA
jgi:hypothetical protein